MKSQSITHAVMITSSCFSPNMVTLTGLANYYKEYHIMVTDYNYQWWIVKTYTPHNVSELSLTPAFQTGIMPIPCPVFKLWCDCIHINHKRMVWFNVLNWNQYRSVLKKYKIKIHLWNGSESHDSPLQILPGPKGTDIYMKITMLSPFSQQVNLLYCLCAVSLWVQSV